MRSTFEEPSASEILLSPQARILLLTRRIGEERVAAACAQLLTGGAFEPQLLAWIGGRHAKAATTLQDYWPRVWAARALLYAWTPFAEAAIRAGLHDPAWRVREMCAKVSRRRELTRAEPILTHLLDDPVLRVRAAADAALTASALSQEGRTPRSSPPRQRRR